MQSKNIFNTKSHCLAEKTHSKDIKTVFLDCNKIFKLKK